MIETASPGADRDVGLIGLAVMGQNLVLNIADHGFRVAVFNRTYTRTERFMKRCSAEPCGGNVKGFETLPAFVSSLVRPR